jgi:hypothetical protein
MTRETTMSEFRQLISSLREQLAANLSRSDALRPLGILIGLILSATLVAGMTKASDLVTTTLVVALILSIVLYLFSYGFCLFKDRDALRSEKYSIHKMAIKHGIYGDSTSGIIEQTPTPTPLLAATPAEPESEDKE